MKFGQDSSARPKPRVKRDGTVWQDKSQIGWIDDHTPFHPRYVGHLMDGRSVFASAVRDLVVNAIVVRSER